MLSNLKSIEENREYLKSVIGVRGKGQIDWRNSVGKEIRYEYVWERGKECSKGALKIIKYEDKNHKIYFEGYEKEIRTYHLIRCSLGGLLNFISLEFKYEIGVAINYLTIIDRECRCKKDKKYKYYKYHCNKCGNEDWIGESHLKEGKGCNACCPSPRKAVLGVNTIWDKSRWMLDLGVSEEDAKKYTLGSKKEIYVKCPDCGKIKRTTPSRIYHTHSIQCSCGDGISYPEKVVENMLIQLEVKYKRQYKDDWSKNRIYDFYLLDANTIIEVHGIQHYEESRRGRSLKEEQENDKLKEELALDNGIRHYIIIDCRESNLQYIKNNILDSELNKLFDLSRINWNKCEKYALKNKVKEVCDFYNEHVGITPENLAKELGASKSTIRKYLNQGTKLGWCEYDGKKEKKHSDESASKIVSQFTLKGELIKIYPSTHEAERQTGINNNSISLCCRGKRKTAGGYVWRYLD